jgi:hypothetical protein
MKSGHSKVEGNVFRDKMKTINVFRFSMSMQEQLPKPVYGWFPDGDNWPEFTGL